MSKNLSRFRNFSEFATLHESLFLPPRMAAQRNIPVCTTNWIGMDAVLSLSLKTHLNLFNQFYHPDRFTHFVNVTKELSLSCFNFLKNMLANTMKWSTVLYI